MGGGHSSSNQLDNDVDDGIDYYMKKAAAQEKALKQNQQFKSQNKYGSSDEEVYGEADEHDKRNGLDKLENVLG